MNVKVDRDLDHISFKDQVREHILSQLTREQELTAGPRREGGIQGLPTLHLLRSALVDAENLTLRIGEQPSQPDTLRGRVGAMAVRIIRRLLFWLTPQIKSANISLLQALEQQAAVSQQILASLQNLASAIEKSQSEVEQRARGDKAITQSQIDDLRKSFNRPQILAQERKHSLDALYVAFEDEFRGSREEIRNRLGVYLPFLHERGLGGAESPILDLGCGRGEWLGLIKNAGLEASGVDSNWMMVAQCQEQGLDVTESDLIAHLKALPSDTKGVVSAFHVLEHLSADHLITVIDETVRVLKPGGVAIFETPNPENILVGAHTFYTDLTHRNPLPSTTLEFLARSRGLKEVQVWKLNPHPDILEVNGDNELVRKWNECFYGARDYAVIGVKDSIPS